MASMNSANDPQYTRHPMRSMVARFSMRKVGKRVEFKVAFSFQSLGRRTEGRSTTLC